MKYSLVVLRSDSTQSIGYNLSLELVLGRILKKKTRVEAGVQGVGARENSGQEVGDERGEVG